MNIDDVKSMMDENGKVGGSLDLRGTGITALPASIDPRMVIR